MRQSRAPLSSRHHEEQCMRQSQQPCDLTVQLRSALSNPLLSRMPCGAAGHP